MSDATTNCSTTTFERQESNTAALPPEVRRLLVDAEREAGGDLVRTAAVVRERLIWDTSITAERATFVRWLVCRESGPGVRHTSRRFGEQSSIDHETR
jgi:hypothetical protein